MKRTLAIFLLLFTISTIVSAQEVPYDYGKKYFYFHGIRAHRKAAKIGKGMVDNYIFVTNFDSLQSALPIQYESDFIKMMNIIEEDFVRGGRYWYKKHSVSETPWFENDEDLFEYLCKIKKRFIIGCDVDRAFDSLEWNNILAQFPKILKMKPDIQEIIRGCFLHKFISKLNSAYYFDTKIKQLGYSIEDMKRIELFRNRISSYNKNIKSESILHAKAINEYYERERLKAKQAKRNEELKIQRKQQRATNLNWTRGLWLSETNMFTVLNGGPQQYRLEISGSSINIQVLTNNRWVVICGAIGYTIQGYSMILNNGDRIKIDTENGVLIYKNRVFYKP